MYIYNISVCLCVCVYVCVYVGMSGFCVCLCVYVCNYDYVCVSAVRQAANTDQRGMFFGQDIGMKQKLELRYNSVIIVTCKKITLERQ